jgi:hypothetical protein
MESWTTDNEDDERLPRPDTLTDTDGVHEQDKADLWWSGPDESVNESDGAGSEREKRNRAQDRLSERRLGVRRQDAKAALPAWAPGDAEISLRSAHTHEPEDLDMEEAGGRGHGTGVKWREDNGREAHHPRSMLENEDHRELGDRDEPDEAREVRVKLELNLPYHDIIGDNEQRFRQEVVFDVADAVGGDPTKVRVLHLEPGSASSVLLALDHGVCGEGMPPLLVAQRLQRQISDPDSVLKQGRYTCETLHVDVWEASVSDFRVVCEPEVRLSPGSDGIVSTSRPEMREIIDQNHYSDDSSGSPEGRAGLRAMDKPRKLGSGNLGSGIQGTHSNLASGSSLDPYSQLFDRVASDHRAAGAYSPLHEWTPEESRGLGVGSAGDLNRVSSTGLSSYVDEVYSREFDETALEVLNSPRPTPPVHRPRSPQHPRVDETALEVLNTPRSARTPQSAPEHAEEGRVRGNVEAENQELQVCCDDGEGRRDEEVGNADEYRRSENGEAPDSSRDVWQRLPGDSREMDGVRDGWGSELEGVVQDKLREHLLEMPWRAFKQIAYRNNVPLIGRQDAGTGRTRADVVADLLRKTPAGFPVKLPPESSSFVTALGAVAAGAEERQAGVDGDSRDQSGWRGAGPLQVPCVIDATLRAIPHRDGVHEEGERLGGPGPPHTPPPPLLTAIPQPRTDGSAATNPLPQVQTPNFPTAAQIKSGGDDLRALLFLDIPHEQLQLIRGESALAQALQKDLMIAARVTSKRITVARIFSADDEAQTDAREGANSVQSGLAVGVEIKVRGAPEWSDCGIKTADARLIVKDLCEQLADNVSALYAGRITRYLTTISVPHSEHRSQISVPHSEKRSQKAPAGHPHTSAPMACHRPYPQHALIDLPVATQPPPGILRDHIRPLYVRGPRSGELLDPDRLLPIREKQPVRGNLAQGGESLPRASKQVEGSGFKV